MLKDGKNKFFVIFFILLNSGKSSPADSIKFLKGISFKIASVFTKESYELYDMNLCRSASIAFDFTLKRKKHNYIFSSGVQYLTINILSPDYTQLEHKKFETAFFSNNKKELAKMLGERNVRLTYFGIPVTFGYRYELNRISIGLGTGVVFFNSFEYNKKEFDMMSTNAQNDRFVGLIVRRNWIRTYSDIHMGYSISEKSMLEWGLEMNLSALLFPLDKHEIIDTWFTYNGPPSKGPNPYPMVYYNPYTYNIQFPFNRFRLLNAFIKFTFLL